MTTHFVFLLEVPPVIRYALYPSPFGTLQIGHEDGNVISVSRGESGHSHDPSPISDLANAQLQEYFRGGTGAVLISL